MKYLLLIVFVIALLMPASVSAQGFVGVYPQPYANDCLMFDTPGPMTLFVVHQFSVGSTASRFRIDFSPGFTGTLLSVSVPNGSAVGDPFAGITVNYGSCLSGSITVLELHLMLTGTSPECAYVRTQPHPSTIDGMLDSYDCSGLRTPVDWRGTHIQHQFDPWFGLCPDLAGFGHSGYGCKPTSEPLPVDASTWGSVKALYR